MYIIRIYSTFIVNTYTPVVKILDTNQNYHSLSQEDTSHYIYVLLTFHPWAWLFHFTPTLLWSDSRSQWCCHTQPKFKNWKSLKITLSTPQGNMRTYFQNSVVYTWILPSETFLQVLFFYQTQPKYFRPNIKLTELKLFHSFVIYDTSYHR